MKRGWNLVAGLAACGVMALVPAAPAQTTGSQGNTGQQSTGSTGSRNTGGQSTGAAGSQGSGSRNSGYQSQNPSYGQPGMESAHRLTADTSFITKAAQDGMAEVEFGRLAAQRASNADVKGFGQKMVDDHTKANDALKDIAAKKGLTLPTTLDAKDQATVDRLSKLNGAEFDRAYMTDTVKDHRTDVNEFKREADRGTDPDTKAFAAKTLPTLESHLKLAETTEAEVKK